MTGEFQTAKGYRIFIYIVTPLLITLFIFVGFLPFQSDTSGLIGVFVLLPVSIGGTALFIYGLIETIKGRIIITESSVSEIKAFGTKTLHLTEIKGYRTDEHYTHIVSNSKEKKSIKISRYVEKHGLIQDWVARQFIELDSFEAQQEEQQILLDHEFGINTQAREHSLSEARRAAKYINIIGGLAGGWIWFYPHPYALSVSVSIILPLIAIISLYAYRGLIRVDKKENSAHPSIIYAILFPGIGLMIRAIMDYEILEYKNLWIAASIIAIALTFLIVAAAKEIKFNKLADYALTLSLAGLMLGYSYGAYAMTNCLYDTSDPQIFRTEVTDKEIGSGKVTTYYLFVKPWGPRTETEKVSVSKDQYEAIDQGSMVEIYLRPGLFKTPWFNVVTE